MRELVLGTRGSPLALWQARHVAERIGRSQPGVRIVERIITTEGDVQQSAPLGRSDVGIFVRRIEQALLAEEIDLAVHSLKDLPTEQPEGLVIACVPPRHDPRDALLTPDGKTFEALEPGTVLGTGSLRRRTMLRHARPDIDTRPVRGNVETRIRKLAEGRFGALVLALAGLERLGLDRMPYRPIDVEVCLPAVGQAALAIETRDGDARTRSLLAELDHGPTHRAVVAERAFLHELGGGCLAPATAYATLDDDGLRLRAAVGDADGTTLMRDEERGRAEQAEALGRRLAVRMKDAGAARLLELARNDPWSSDPA